MTRPGKLVRTNASGKPDFSHILCVVIAMRVLVLLILSTTIGFSQAPPTEPPKETPPPAQGTQPPPAEPGPNVPTTESNQNKVDTRERPNFSTSATSAPVTGMVVVEGGRPLPDEATVQAVCGGSPGQIVYTRNRFRVTIGQSRYSESQPGTHSAGMGLAGCEIRVSLPGFLPATAAVHSTSPYGTDVGVVVLHPRTDVSGFTYSFTSLSAPKDAQKSFEKGLQQAGRNKLGAAQGELENAVRIHPSYASAWFELGVVYHKQSRIEDARKAYERAAQADDKFVKPVLQLAMLSAGERKWEETARLTSLVISKNPFEFAQAFLYNAVANYNLKNPQAAEKAVLRAIELDPQHRFPKAFHLLGTIQADRSDSRAAVENLRAYLQYAPKAPEADAVRRRIAELEASGADR